MARRRMGVWIWQEIFYKHRAGRFYFFSEKNPTTVIAPGREFHLLAENQLEERLMATPAVTGDAFLLRSKTHLYRLEEKKGTGIR